MTNCFRKPDRPTVAICAAARRTDQRPAAVRYSALSAGLQAGTRLSAPGPQAGTQVRASLRPFIYSRGTLDLGIVIRNYIRRRVHTAWRKSHADDVIYEIVKLSVRASKIGDCLTESGTLWPWPDKLLRSQNRVRHAVTLTRQTAQIAEYAMKNK